MTTDAGGQVVFAVPFAVPSGRPALTATATPTDLQGDTSGFEDGRQATLEAPTGIIRVPPDRPTAITNGPGDAIAIQDPGDGPLVPEWHLKLSVSAGAISLSTTVGLTGMGDGTASLSYAGTAAALDAALAGMTFTPPPGYQGAVTLSLDARSTGTAPIQSSVR